MRKIAIILMILVVAFSSISCATGNQSGQDARGGRSDLHMPPGWGSQYGGR